MRTHLLLLFTVICFHLTAEPSPVTIQVDVAHEKGLMKPIWAWFGYDEPNYTYMKDGQKLLSTLADLSPVPVYVRAHNLMTSGDGTPALKWGSTNMYTEDEEGNPVYHWELIDRIFDTYVQRGMKPLAQIGFMPEALSTHPVPYQHQWQPGRPYNEIYTGWAYPPKDYDTWGELIYQWVTHCVERYGKAEVESWYWELWNEPDANYLMDKDRASTYCKMYDYASHAVKRALPTARMGGPHTTGGGKWLLKAFIDHCFNGTNAVTGAIGAPLDFLAFHAKGSPRFIDNHVRMGMHNHLKDVYENLSIIASHPAAKRLPVIIGESDPEGCAACGMLTDPQNAYRNGTMYSSYTAASLARIIAINDHLGTNLIGAVNWSFEFENQPWFYGFRDLATNGVDKPVLNVFRMMGMMSGKRVEVAGDLRFDYATIRDAGVRGTESDVNALASCDDNAIAVMVWNYHDDDVSRPATPVNLTVKNIQHKRVKVYHYRIDDQHSNAYEVWKNMGSPQNPTPQQIATLEEAGQLALLSPPKTIRVKEGECRLALTLPIKAVSLIRLEY